MKKMSEQNEQSKSGTGDHLPKKKPSLISVDYVYGSIPRLYIEVAMTTRVVVCGSFVRLRYTQNPSRVYFRPYPRCTTGYDSMEPRQHANSSYPLQFRNRRLWLPTTLQIFRVRCNKRDCICHFSAYS